MKFTRAAIAAALGAGALVEFVFWGGGGIGLTLLFLILLFAYYLACGLPKGSRRGRIEHGALAFMAALLALCFSLFDNGALRAADLLALTYLMGLLFLHGTVGEALPWDLPAFTGEHLAGYFARPFCCIARPWKELSNLRKADREGEVPHTRAARRVALQIVLALLVSIPLLLVLTALLAKSDPVFTELLRPLAEAIENLRIGTIAGKAILFLFLFPFTASAVWSYRDHMRLLSRPAVPVAGTSGSGTAANGAAGSAGPASAADRLRFLPPAFSITVLALVNVLYILYAAIQFLYLFSSWRGELPDGLTYAEYARNGFFELAFVSAINAVLLFCSIRMTRRSGKSKAAVRCLSVLLLFLSSVQLASALSRMNLYIGAYGLSRLRYFVTAFMVLTAVCFAFLLLREFLERFPLFRSLVLAGAAALCILNFTVPDAQIAKYNIGHYLSGELKGLDLDYIRNDLSAEAHVVLLEKEEAIAAKDPALGAEISLMKDGLGENLVQSGEMAWKNGNLSRELLKARLEAHSA